MKKKTRRGEVVQTIPADLSMMFIVGLVFSWQTARQAQKTGHLFFNKYFATLFLFQTFILMPQAVYYYVAHPDWCWMYWVDSKEIPFSFVVFAYFSYYPSLMSGYTLGFYLEKKETHLSFKALKISMLFLLLFSIFSFKRLFYIGTFSDFYAGSAKPLFFMPSLSLLVFGGMAASLALLLYMLRGFGKELDIPAAAIALPKDRVHLKPVVSACKVSGDVEETIRHSLHLWNGAAYLKDLFQQKSKTVIIKPNFAGGGKDKKGTQTSPEVLRASIHVLREIQGDADIYIVESGSIFWWELEQLIKDSVYEKLFQEERVTFVNLSKEKRVKYCFGGRMDEDEIPELLLKPHLLIDIPVAKTHAYFKMSGAIKNLFGLLPEGYKLFRYHAGKGMDDKGNIFIDIYRNFPPDLVIIDGTTSCEGHGPFGTPKETNFVLTSNDAASADFLLSEVMGYNKEEIPYLKALMDKGWRTDFDLNGESLKNIKPAAWKHTDKLRGLSSNFFRIFKERLVAVLCFFIFQLMLSSYIGLLDTNVSFALHS